jgi:hypothetical protein
MACKRILIFAVSFAKLKAGPQEKCSHEKKERPADC